MAKKILLNMTPQDIKEILDQDKLIHTSNISLRDRKRITETRNPYQRDYGRILYSSAFRRLQGKMQVLGVENSAFFRNRLTHSLEVAQIAKGIRLRLDETCYKRPSQLSDIFLLEAAALAHDIGHPAFGHKGERVLNAIAQKFGMHFEGNAQNFRVLRKIEKKNPSFEGLNLTWRTLLAINKYIVPEAFGVEKFMYREDYYDLQAFREKNNLKKIRTLDVQIIELADDIAYAVHDLEDTLSQGYFSIDELFYEMSIMDSAAKKFTQAEVSHAASIFEKTVNERRKKILKASTTDRDNLQEYSQLLRKAITSQLTKMFINDVVLGTVTEDEAKEHGTIAGARELKLDKYGVLCKLLSKKIFKCVCRQPHVAQYELKGEKVIKSLFNLYTDPKANANGLLLPLDYRAQADKKDSERDKKNALAAINYIAGMMDNYAIDQYEHYFSTPFDKILLI